MSGVSPLKSKSQTDWNKCFLCRTEKKNYLIARNIPLFQGINQLPIILDLNILDEGGGIEETLRWNNANYHQNCRLLFNSTMLERTRKTASCSNISSEDGKNKIRRTSIEGHMCFYARKKIQPLNFGKP